MSDTACPILDGHNDTFLRLFAKGLPLQTFMEEDCPTQISYAKAKQGGLAGGLFAICVPFSPEQTSDKPFNRFEPVDFSSAQSVTLTLLEQINDLVRAFPDRLVLVRSGDDLDMAMASGRLAIVIHFEGAEAIDPELANLETYYQLGLRSLGIMWSRPNAFGNGVEIRFPSTPDTGKGLSSQGLKLVKKCNEMGILLDVSHMNQKEFDDVASTSTFPLVATHSGVHALCPSSRNLTDRQLRTIADSGGVVGINFEVKYLHPESKLDLEIPLQTLLDHVHYLERHIGVDHIAIGSDFDGANIPKCIGHAGGLAHLRTSLQECGLSPTAVQKILCDNWKRVWRATWR